MKACQKSVIIAYKAPLSVKHDMQPIGVSVTIRRLHHLAVANYVAAFNLYALTIFVAHEKLSPTG